jgi:hypothetical protein
VVVGKVGVGTGLLGSGAVGVGLAEWFPKQRPAMEMPLQVVVGVGAGTGGAFGFGFGVYGPSMFHAVPPKSGVGKLCTVIVPNIFCAYACQMVAGHSPP